MIAVATGSAVFLVFAILSQAQRARLAILWLSRAGDFAMGTFAQEASSGNRHKRGAPMTR